MFRRPSILAAAVAFGFALNGVAFSQSNWEIADAFSVADGSIQFVVLSFAVFTGAAPQLPALAGQTLIAGDGTTEHTYTFPSNVIHYYGDNGFDAGPCEGNSESACGSHVLVATKGFADLNAVTPDFVVPNGFLFPSGFVRFGASEYRYAALPTANAAMPIVSALAIDNAGGLVPFTAFDGLPLGVNPIIEYHNAGLDDYFLTAYPREIQELDSRSPPDWQRTGRSFPAWTSTFSTVALSPANAAFVCRLWLGDSHFYSTSWSECSQAARRPGSSLETYTAFLAALPNVDTGACPAGQVPLYRLWNPRGSSHRYTTDAGVRDEMLTRGWILEGYGPDNVAMCVGGAR